LDNSASDLVVILVSGLGGMSAAIRAFPAQMRVVVIRGSRPWGVASIGGVFPSKALLLRRARWILFAGPSKEHGIEVGEVRFDFSNDCAVAGGGGELSKVVL